MVNNPLPKLALGTWLMGGTKNADPNNDDQRDIGIIQTAIENHVILIDTAQNYAAGKCEEIVGRATSNYPRNQFQILTKQTKEKLSFDEVIKGCKDSMQRLEVEYIDYFVCHAPNANFDMRDFFKAANQLYKDGLIRHMGVSNFGPKALQIALDTSELPIALNQVSFSLEDEDIITTGTYDFCLKNNIPIQAYRPLASLGSDKEAMTALKPIASKYDLTEYQTAIAYLNSYDNICFTIRASTTKHWQEIKTALDIKINEEDVGILKKIQQGKGNIVRDLLEI